MQTTTDTLMATDARQAFDNAFSLIAAGRIEDAEGACRDSLARLPGDINLLGLLGAILLKRGRIDEAESLLLRTIALQPAFAKPHEDLGTLYLQRNQPAEAAASFETAVRLDHQPSALLGLATALSRCGQPQRAEKICGEILSKDSKNIRALRLLAKIASDGQRYAAAEGLLRRIVELAPDFQPGYSDFAGFLVERSRFHEAVGLFEHAIDLRPDQAALHQRLADTLAIINRPQAALGSYERCLALEPGNLPALMGRGHMQRIVGQREAAISSYVECTRLQPTAGEAWWNLASIRGYRFAEADRQQMKSLLDAAELDEPSRIALNFALARACEADSDFETAWSYYAQGNAAKRRAIKYDPVETATQNDTRIRVFTHELMQRHATGNAAATAAGATPVFVVGMPRSGSTLIEQILASHSQVEGCGELPYVPMLAAMLGERKVSGEKYPENLARLKPGDLLQLGKDYLNYSAAHHHDSSKFFTDKMPVNFQHIGLIHLMLPQAIIIDARRNALDACIGNFRQLFAQGKNQSYDLLELGEYYLEYRRLMDHWDAILPGRVLTLHYENVVRDLEGEVRRLLQHCGLPFEDACLDFHASRRPVNTASAEQVREPVYSDAVGYWKNYESQLTELKRILEPVL
ncbi:MAG TPA: sulfotransferase [Woeseiaceae bacterium]|nr:sulfotransferase [Woeseiaceae bacterium]